MTDVAANMHKKEFGNCKGFILCDAKLNQIKSKTKE